MSRVLIVYGSTYGQTAKIAARISDLLRQQGLEVTLRKGNQIDPASELGSYGGIMVGASLVTGGYQKYIRSFVKQNRAALGRVPTAFFAVSGSAGGTEEEQCTARNRIDGFLKQAEWKPELTASFAGAVTYSKYNPILRWFMHRLMRKAGRAPDVSRDYEYTDWLEVERFAHAFGALVKGQVGAVVQQI